MFEPFVQRARHELLWSYRKQTSNRSKWCKSRCNCHRIGWSWQCLARWSGRREYMKQGLDVGLLPFSGFRNRSSWAFISSRCCSSCDSIDLTIFSITWRHGSQTVRRDALAGCFNFLRESHKSKLSVVLFIEVITVKFSSITLPKKRYYLSAVRTTADSLSTISWIHNCSYCLVNIVY